MTKRSTKTRVLMIESEAGWGQRVDEIKTFPSRAKAVAFAEAYNRRHNTAPTAPSWYVKAEVEGEGFTR